MWHLSFEIKVWSIIDYFHHSLLLDWAPFYWHGLTSISPWISNHIPYDSVGRNFISIHKLQRCKCNCLSLGMDKKFPLILYWTCDYLSMLRLKLIHVSNDLTNWICTCYVYSEDILSGETAHNGSGHYNDVIMGAMASQIGSLTIIYSTVYSGAIKRKDQSSASLAFVWGIHRWPVNSPHKWPVMWKMFLFDDIIMFREKCQQDT